MHSFLSCSSHLKSQVVQRAVYSSVDSLFLSYCLKIFWKKSLCYSYFKSHIERVTFPIEHTIYRSCKTCPVDSLLYKTKANVNKHLLHYQETFSCVRTYYMRCGKPDVIQETWRWPMMAAILQSNSHHKEGSKLKL